MPGKDGEVLSTNEIKGTGMEADYSASLHARHAKELINNCEENFGKVSKEKSVDLAVKAFYDENKIKKDPKYEALIRNYETARYSYHIINPDSPEDQLYFAKKMFYYKQLIGLYDANKYSDFNTYHEDFCPDKFIEEKFCGEENKAAYLQDRDAFFTKANGDFKKECSKEREKLTNRITEESRLPKDQEYQKSLLSLSDKDINKRADNIFSRMTVEGATEYLPRANNVYNELVETYKKLIRSNNIDEAIDLTADLLLKQRLAENIQSQPIGTNEELSVNDKEDKAKLTEYLKGFAKDTWSTNLKGIVDVSENHSFDGHGYSAFDTVRKNCKKVFNDAGVDYSVKLPESIKPDSYSQKEHELFGKGYNVALSSIESSNSLAFDAEIKYAECTEDAKKIAQEMKKPLFSSLAGIVVERDKDKLFDNAAKALLTYREVLRTIQKDGDTNPERIKYGNEEDLAKIRAALADKYSDNTTELRTILSNYRPSTFELLQDLTKELKLSPLELSKEEYEALTYVEPEETEEERLEREESERKQTELEEQKRLEEERIEAAKAEKAENRIAAVTQEKSEAAKARTSKANPDENAVFTNRIKALNKDASFDAKISATVDAVKSATIFAASKRIKDGKKLFKDNNSDYSDIVEDILKKQYADKLEDLMDKLADKEAFKQLVRDTNDAYRTALENKTEEYQNIADNEYKKGTAKSGPEAVKQAEFVKVKTQALIDAKTQEEIYAAASELIAAKQNFVPAKSDSFTAKTEKDIQLGAPLVKPLLEKLANPKIANMDIALKNRILSGKESEDIVREIQKGFNKPFSNAKKEELEEVLVQAGIDLTSKDSMERVMVLNDPNKNFISANYDLKYIESFNKMLGSVNHDLSSNGTSLFDIDSAEYNAWKERGRTYAQLKPETFINMDLMAGKNRLVIHSRENPGDFCFINKTQNGYVVSEPISKIKGADEATAVKNGFASKDAMDAAIQRQEAIVEAQKQFKDGVTKVVENYKAGVNVEFNDDKILISATYDRLKELGIVKDLDLDKDTLGFFKKEEVKEDIKEEVAESGVKEELNQNVTEEINTEINTDSKEKVTEPEVKEEPNQDEKEEIYTEINTDRTEINTDVKDEVAEPEVKEEPKQEADREEYEQELAMFGKLAKDLDKSKTFVNSKEYTNIITLVTALSKDDSKEGPKARLAKYALAGKAINDYIAHKSKDGVKPNVFKKLAAVENASKFLDGKLKEHRGETVKFNVGKDRSVDVNVSDIKLSFEDKFAVADNNTQATFRNHFNAQISQSIVAIKGNEETARVGAFMKSTNECMNKILLDAAEKNPNNLQALAAMRDQFGIREFAENEIQNHKEEVLEAQGMQL